MKKKFKRPRLKFPREHISTTVDKNVKDVLEMLGFDIPRLMEELLKNVTGQRRCPCCGREVRPVIVGRKLDLKEDAKP